ncbi:MAG: DUF1360 domain-containing protein [Rhodospirillales bacterium]|nr:DUF1360 domain-containing protein [Acetobacter sp.]
MAPLRAPFVRFKENAGEGEVEEVSCGNGGFQETVGDLLTCSYRFGVWIVTPMLFGMAIAPKLMRIVVGILANITTVNFMHRLYLGAKNYGNP